MKKVATLLVTLGLSLVLAGPVLAAKPHNQACLGHDVSGYAQGGADFGAFISGIATTTRGIGEEVQGHLAGQTPEEVLPNTCND